MKCLPIKKDCSELKEAAKRLKQYGLLPMRTAKVKPYRGTCLMFGIEGGEYQAHCISRNYQERHPGSHKKSEKD